MAIHKENDIADKQRQDALAKAKKIYDEHADDLATNLANITKKYVTEGTVNGVTGNERSITAGYLGSAWLKNETSALYNQFENGVISEREYEAAFQNLGSK